MVDSHARSDSVVASTTPGNIAKSLFVARTARILDLLDEVKAMKKKAPNWAHLSAISNFTEGCECSICTGEMLLESCKVHELQRQVDALRERAEQAEKDIATLGVAELMVRNPNIDSFVREHEKRTEQAEADRKVLAAEVLASRQQCTARKAIRVMEPGARCGYGHPCDPMMAGKKCPVCAAIEATDASGALTRGGGE